ncbi:MAG: response regulator [Methanothrix sp.]|nr:response regulator [Methanothrix sp.]
MFPKKGSCNSMRILLAEDNPCSQELMLMMLKYMGLYADVANNGLEVLQVLETQSYDVILMDIQMPVMDGLEATRVIRRRWHDRSIKIIAVTGCNQKGYREICIQAGMDDYMSKPVKREDLERMLNYPDLLV